MFDVSLISRVVALYRALMRHESAATPRAVLLRNLADLVRRFKTVKSWYALERTCGVILECLSCLIG